MPLHEELVRVIPGADELPRRSTRGRTVILLLGAVMVGSIALFLTWEVNGHWDFALPRRLEQLAALAIVGVAVAVSTVVFQTLTENRILTPSIMGYDALYILLAASLVFTLGGMRYQSIPDLPLFLANTATLVVVSVFLYQWVFKQTSHGLYTLILVGVIAATLFSSITSFMFRVMDPNEFEVLMTALFATFNQIDTDVLLIAGVLLVVGIVAAARTISTLDVLTLGREQAVTLGLEYKPTVTRLLTIVAVLVAVSTSLVGPITFLGLLVANLAYYLTGTFRHTTNFVAASLISVTALVLGQAALQHLFSYAGTIGSIINLVGGVFFVLLLVRTSQP